jgi:hypothetical protein
VSLPVAEQAADAFLELAQAQLQDIEIFPGPPAGPAPERQVLWIEESESEYEWRTLGVHPGNRSEATKLTVHLAVYRQAESHRAAQAAARAAAAEFEEQIEQHVLGDTCDLGGVVTDARVSKATRTWTADADGWTRHVVLEITANNYPG